MRSILLCNDAKSVHYVYSDEMLAQLAHIAGLDTTIYSRDAVLETPEGFADVDYAFSTWGMPVFEEEEIRRIFPNLKAVFYGAGSVQFFARPFLNCGIKVFSAWAANAVPVAEYTIAQIILANKGFFLTSRLHKAYDHEASYNARHQYPGNYGASIGIIGAGMIGKLVIQMLKAYKLPVKVFDPFLADEAAAELGVHKCSLEEVFATCQVVSNHLANNAQTVGMLNGPLFASMLPYATQFRAGDVPFDWMMNFRRLVDIRLTLGDNIPVHADPAYWSPDEYPVNVARHMMVMFLGVPMLSMDVNTMPAEHLSIVKFYLDLYREKQPLLNFGHWSFIFSSGNAGVAMVENEQEVLAVIMDGTMLSKVGQLATGRKLTLLNVSSDTLHLNECEAAPGDTAFLES